MSWKNDVLSQIRSDFRGYEEIRPYRESRLEFIGKVLKSDTGTSFIVEPLNKSWIDHLEFCENNDLFPGFLAPFGHGKTVTVVIGYLLKKIGENPNLRAKIISSAENEAIKRTKAIKRYIEEDRDFQEVYPEITPSDTWSESKFTVKRTSRAVDNTVEAKGVLAAGIGGRMDLAVFDDAVSYGNVIKEPGLREKVRETIENVWLSRLDPGGVAMVIATAWHESDANHHFMKNPKFCFLIQRVSEDFERIECEVTNSPDPVYQEFVLPLSTRWPKKALIDKCNILGQRAFDRGFRQRAYSDEERIFKTFSSCFDYALSINKIRDVFLTNRAKNFISMGVDLSNKKRPGNVIFVLGIDDLNYKYYLECVTGKWTSPEMADQIAYLHNKYRPDVIVVENNAYQTALIEWIQDSKKEYNFWHKIVPFTTGSQKLDEQLGLPALEIEFGNRSWKIPCREQQDHKPTCNCSFCRWIREVHDYPMYDTTDCLMASWFAWHGIDKVFGGRHLVPEAIGRSDCADMPDIDSSINFVHDAGASILASSDWEL
jgi:hypothetical protein